MNNLPINIDTETARLSVEFYSANRALKSLVETETWQHLKQLTQSSTELHDRMNALWEQSDSQSIHTQMNEIVKALKKMDLMASTIVKQTDYERFRELIIEILTISTDLQIQLKKNISHV